MNKDFTVVKITIIEIKTLKISNATTEYANIRFWTQIVKVGPPPFSLIVSSSAQIESEIEITQQKISTSAEREITVKIKENH